MPAGELSDYKLTSMTIQINTAFVILAVRPELTVEGLAQNPTLVSDSGVPFDTFDRLSVALKHLKGDKLGVPRMTCSRKHTTS